MIDTTELARRRRILGRYIGEPVCVKRRHLSAPVPGIGMLVDVKRTKAIVRFGPDAIKGKNVFGESGEWSMPIEFLLLPDSVEPVPGQLEFIS